MVKVMKEFVRTVVDQDEQVCVRAKLPSASCGRQSVPHSNIILNTCIEREYKLIQPFSDRVQR